MRTASRICLAALLCWAAFLCGAAPAHAAADPPWWNNSWSYRKLLKVTSGHGPRRVWIYTGDRARPDGRDIRVVGPEGRPAPFGVVRSTDEGRHLVLFNQAPAPEGMEGEENQYCVYFGNPKAARPAQGPPAVGVFLETRAMPPEADVSSWDAALATIRKTETV